MSNDGVLFAFDKDAQRAAGLRASMARLGASCVHTEHADFLAVSADDPQYAKVCQHPLKAMCLWYALHPSIPGRVAARIPKPPRTVHADLHDTDLP